jgi:hypothetical protein
MLIHNPHDKPPHRGLLIIHQLPGAFAIAADEDRVSHTSTEVIDHQSRFTISLALVSQRLDDEQLPPIHAWVLGAADRGADDFGLLHL